MLSFPKVSNEIMVLVASFVSILLGKSEISSTSFHQWKYYQILDGSHYIETVDIAKIIKMGSLHASQKWSFSD
jgi:hypothetical protein